MRTTPAVVRLLAGTAIAVTVALCAALTVAFGEARHGLDLIGHRDGPTVISTSNLYFALADMDAQVANVLLVSDRTDLGISRGSALRIYEQRRGEVADYLQRTGTVAGRDPVVGGELRGFLVALGGYEALAAQAILVDEQTPTQPGRPPTIALGLYRQATDLMHQHLLPAAKALTGRSATLVELRYAHARSSTERWLVVASGLGFALLAALAGLQVFLSRRYRRVLNPTLTVVTVVAFVLVAGGVWTLVRGQGHLRAVKKDAFDSVLALEQARAISYDANADESRYLLDPARAGQYERAFAVKSGQLVDLGVGDRVEGYDAALADALANHGRAAGNVTFGGYYGTALRNITFPGERAAADLTLQRYQAYQLADRGIRRLSTAGSLTEAIRLCTSFSPGDSNALFISYDRELTVFVGINTRAFAHLTKTGDDNLSGRIWISLLLTLAIVLLIPVGVRPRLAEYRR